MGFVLSLIVAFLISLRTVFEKKALEQIDEFVITFGIRFFAGTIIFLVIFLFEIEGGIDENFLFLALIGGLVCTLATIFALKGLKNGDLSLVSPIVTFTPLFLLITSPIIINEFPSFLGVLGVLLIFIGSYILNISKLKIGYLEPIISLSKNKGVRYMFLASIIWSIGSNIDKLGVTASSPLIWSASINFLSAIMIFPFAIKRIALLKVGIPRRYLFIAPLIGIVAALSSIIQLYAIGFILVIYVISLKRLSVVFQVLFGRFLFQEKDFKERFAGVIIMTIGAIIIVVFS